MAYVYAATNVGGGINGALQYGIIALISINCLWNQVADSKKDGTSLSKDKMSAIFFWELWKIHKIHVINMIKLLLLIMIHWDSWQLNLWTKYWLTCWSYVSVVQFAQYEN